MCPCISLVNFPTLILPTEIMLEIQTTDEPLLANDPVALLMYSYSR